MGNKLIFCLCMLVFFTNGVFGVGTAEMEGPSVTLHTEHEYEQIFWRFGPENLIIARCNIRDTPLCEITLGTDELINFFRGRLNITDDGSLTIKNISTEQTGPYTQQLINKSKKSDERKFNVSVSTPETVNDSDCSTCVHKCSVGNVTHATLSWNISSTSPFLEVKYQDHSNICVVNTSVSEQTEQDCVCRRPRSDSESGLNPGQMLVLVLVLVLVGGAVVVAAAVYFYKKQPSKKPDEETGTSCVEEDEDCSAVGDTDAYYYEKQNGAVTCINSLKDERRSSSINGEPWPTYDT